jgi:hypothetical protein
VDIWRPLQFSPADARRRGGHWLNVIGRLRKDVTLGSAQQEARLHAAQLEKQYPNAIQYNSIIEEDVWHSVWAVALMLPTRASVPNVGNQ